MEIIPGRGSVRQWRTVIINVCDCAEIFPHGLEGLGMVNVSGEYVPRPPLIGYGQITSPGMTR